GLGRSGDGGLSGAVAAGAGRHASLHRDAASRLRRGASRRAHARRCHRLADEQRRRCRGTHRRLRQGRHRARLPSARLSDLPRSRRRHRRASRRQGARPGQARDDHVGQHGTRSLRGHHRADHAGRGGHRRAEEGPPPLRCAAPPAARRERALTVAPKLRGLLSRPRRQIVAFDDAPAVTEFVSSVDAPAISQIGPATPDHTIYTKRLPCFVALERTDDPGVVTAAIETSLADFEHAYTTYVDAHRDPGVELLDALPRVILVPGLGMFTAGRDRRTAGIVSDIYHHTIDVIGNATAFGRYVSLTAKDAFDVEYWPLELSNLTLPPPANQLARRIA